MREKEGRVELSANASSVRNNKKVLLVRHGRTDWNASHRFQGCSNIPLNETGLMQAEKLAARLAGWPVEAVYSSPLDRALETARAVSRHHSLDPIVLDDLVEVCFGDWEGKHLKTLHDQENGLLKAWMKDPFFNLPAGAESWETVRTRTERAVKRILEDERDNIVVVSHGGVMRALFAVLLDLDPHTVWNIKTSNCAISGVEVRERQISLAFANDDLHLRNPSEALPLPVW